MEELKSLIVHNRIMINSLSPSKPMTDWMGGSAPDKSSLESLFDLSTSRSLSSPMEGELADGTLSLLEVLGHLDLTETPHRSLLRHGPMIDHSTPH